MLTENHALVDEWRGAAAPPPRLTQILDLWQFPRADRLSLHYAPEHSRFHYELATGGDICLDRVRAASWRRPQPFGFEPGLAAAFAQSECDEAVSGLWQALNARWMNPPVLDAAASRKSWQLRLACEMGLNPPDTLITNCAATARAFLARLPEAIYKPFAGSPRYWRETRRIGEDEMRRIEQLRHAPTILQQRIPGEDIRVTVVGTRMFAAAIDSSGGSYDTDFRMNQHVTIRETDLPATVAEGIGRLMARLGLVYGALDFSRTPKGDWRFLEINPAGQWLFVEEQTGQPIARAVADQLSEMAA